jgi:thiamine-phosphate pyrophosphorylase
MSAAVDLSLYAILDPERTQGRDLARLAEAAVAGGITLLQYRDKHAGTRVMIERARAIRQALAGRVPLLINDRVDVALASGADGVHVGREDMAPADARRLLGPAAIIGVTLKTTGDLPALEQAGVSYGCIGGVFPTASKDNADPPIGLDGLRLMRAEAGQVSACPVGAIAGIDAHNAASVIAAGADGIAVIGAIFMAEDVTAAAAHLRRIVTQALQDRQP